MPGVQNFGMAAGQNTPQITPNNLRSFLLAGFARNPTQPGTWQANQGVAGRAGIVCELVTALRLANGNNQFGPAVKSAMNIEAQLWNQSSSEVSYPPRPRSAPTPS